MFVYEEKELMSQGDGDISKTPSQFRPMMAGSNLIESSPRTNCIIVNESGGTGNGGKSGKSSHVADSRFLWGK